ncbi:MAG: glycosyltransferase [Leptolyngbya sp. Prado105]|jgi:glycosyltransferase involved in cell wall biosynthesis|nr:glycosyltransferase [Leptolyngbya sp. Prado105]
MNESSPLVSILINNYNYARFLQQAIDSALDQTYDQCEVIVVDDGSTDDSRGVIERYGDRIVPVFKQNGGQSSAFNAGFNASQGEIICFLDADDYWFPDKVSQVVQHFQSYPNAGWLFHRLQRTDSAAMREQTGWVELDFRASILKGQPSRIALPATSALNFRREVLQQILPMPEPLRISADNFLRLAAIHLAPGLLLEAQLAVHRIHGKNAFESRKDTTYLHAEVNIQTSYYLRERFPEIKAFTDQLFSHSLGQVFGSLGFAKVSQISEANDYLRDFFPMNAWLSQSPRIFYNYAKSRISHS